MSQLKTLLKNDLRTSFRFNSFSNNPRKRNNKKKSSLAGPILLLILFIFLSFMYSGMFTFLSKVADMRYTGLYFGTALGAIVCLVMTIAKAYSSLFKTKDFELLVSLPIPTKTILLSKFISLSILGYAAFALFYIPAVICNILIFGLSLPILIFSILTVMLAPMLIITLCSFLSYLVNSLLSKFKYQKAVKTFFSIIFFIVYFVAIFSFSTISSSMEGESVESAITICTQIENIFSKIFLPSIWITKAMQGEYMFYLAFAAICIIPFTLYTLYVGKNFLRINLMSRRVYTNKNYQFKALKGASPKISLVKREFKTLFSSTTYLINTITGPLLSVFMVILFSTLFSNLEAEEGGELLLTFLPIIVLLISSFMLGMVPTTSCSINFEGKRLWLLKTAPLSTKSILQSKLLIYTFFTFPFILINGILMNVLLEMDIVTRICCFIIPFFIVNIYGIEGLLVNTKSYRLDWNTEAEAIKQGTNTLWSLLASFILSIILFAPTLVILAIFGIVASIILLLVLSIAILIIMYALLMKHGTKLFDRIPA